MIRRALPLLLAAIALGGGWLAMEGLFDSLRATLRQPRAEVRTVALDEPAREPGAAGLAEAEPPIVRVYTPGSAAPPVAVPAHSRAGSGQPVPEASQNGTERSPGEEASRGAGAAVQDAPAAPTAPGAPQPGTAGAATRRASAKAAPSAPGTERELSVEERGSLIRRLLAVYARLGGDS